MDKAFLRCVVFSNQADSNGLAAAELQERSKRMLPLFARFLHALV